jgi:pimeloyl-ACP methyl ester carboxylesterase
MVIIVGIAAILFTILIIWWRQERITFQPPAPPYDDAGNTTRVSLRCADGVEIFGYLLGDRSDTGLLIAFHGNADLAVWQIPWAQDVSDRSGWRVLLVEYRGYAGNPGSPSYVAVQADARAALAYARETLGIPLERIAYFGHSLGSGIAAELAAEATPSTLILQSPFTSARDMARIIVARPIALIWNMVSRVHYDTAAHVATLDCPVHVAHGDRDFIVPTRMGRRVHAVARNPGQLLIVSGAGHNDVAERGGVAYWRWIVLALTGSGIELSAGSPQ